MNGEYKNDRTKPIHLTLIVVAVSILLGVIGLWPKIRKDPATEEKKMPPHVRLNKLSPAESRVIRDKGTEAPNSGELVHNKESGFYICRQCDAPLYHSQDKFDSGCGWPSFDDEIFRAVERRRDADGIRTEILCRRCGGHLGHVFSGEGFTQKNTRHCVNSISMKFVPEKNLKKAVFAAGCFWGVEHLFKQKQGVIDTRVGYSGGHTKNPSYQEVCRGDTGHVEAIEIRYDPQIVGYSDLVKFFFEIHNPAQANGQGPDIGPQYLSVIFFEDQKEKEIAASLSETLRKSGQKVATKIEPASEFWPAEAHHQDYYSRKGGVPYCHAYTPRFEHKE